MAAPDVSEDTGDREVFPTPFAFPVAAQVTAQRCDVGVGQPGRQPSEEAALLPRHATAVYQDSRRRAPSGRTRVPDRRRPSAVRTALTMVCADT